MKAIGIVILGLFLMVPCAALSDNKRGSRSHCDPVIL